MLRESHKTKIIVILAVILSLILSIQLAARGQHFFIDVEAGLRGPNKDFPDWNSRFRAGLSYTLLNGLYFIWLFKSKHGKKLDTFKEVLQYGAIFPLIALTAYPITGDVRLYLQYGLMGLNEVNPFITPAGSFNSSLLPFLAWQQASTYGLISQGLFMAVAFVSTSLITGVYVLKLFCLLFHVLNSYLIWRSLSESKHRSLITVAYFINPFLLFEQVVNAHLDVCLTTTLILLIICIKQGRYVASVLALWLGFLTKTLPVIWLPLVVTFLIRKRRWRSISVSASVSLIIVFVLSKTILPTTQAWINLTNPGVVGRISLSLHALMSWILSKLENLSPLLFIPPRELVLNTFSIMMYIVFSACYLWLIAGILLRKHYSENDLILSIGWATAALFLFVSAWYRPWYASILAPIVVLNLNSQLFVRVTVSLSILISCAYYMF